MHNNKMLYDTQKIVPPFAPHCLGGENFGKDSTSNKEKEKKSKHFDASSKHPYIHKINKKIKTKEVAIYLTISKLRENLSCRSKV